METVKNSGKYSFDCPNFLTSIIKATTTTPRYRLIMKICIGKSHDIILVKLFSFIPEDVVEYLVFLGCPSVLLDHVIHRDLSGQESLHTFT